MPSITIDFWFESEYFPPPQPRLELPSLCILAYSHPAFPKKREVKVSREPGCVPTVAALFEKLVAQLKSKASRSRI